MLKLISYKEISRFSDLFFGQFQLRHREFIERQSYEVKTLDAMEFDEYDTLASHYLVYTENGKDVLGCSRLTPINMGCMLADHFPELVDDPGIFTRPDIWEGTRFCVDSRLPPERRRRICEELAAGYIEFGLAQRADRIIGLMPTLILRSVFGRSGVHLEMLGEAKPIGAHAKIRAAAIPINEEQRHSVRAATGLEYVLYARPPETRANVA